MGCTHSQETQSPRRPPRSRSLPAPAPFQVPLPAAATIQFPLPAAEPFQLPLLAPAPFQSAPDTAERTLKAIEGWKKKRAILKREWSSRIGKCGDELQSDTDETYLMNPGNRMVGAEGQYAYENWSAQYANQNWSASYDEACEAEAQYAYEDWSASDDGACEAEAQYADRNWTASETEQARRRPSLSTMNDDGADEAVQPSRMRGKS